MKRLVLGALLAIFAAQMLAFAPEAGAQDYYRRYQEAPPPSERSARQRRYVDEDDAYFQRRMQYYRRDQVARRQQEARRSTEAARPRSVFPIPFLQRLFGSRDDDEREDPGDWRARRDPGAVEVRPQRRTVRRSRPPAEPAKTPLPPNVVALPKVAPDTFVAVFGDTIADELAGGLEEAFADAPGLAVRRHVKANAGLVRSDYFDVVADARKAVESEQITFAVIDVGVNDRQPFVDMRHAPPLSDEWTRRYGERVNALLAPFREKKIPVYWVGLAPSESRKASADHTALNTLIKERVEAAGGTYVDVWEGFVDEGGAYTADGPQLDGQIGRLRLDDGVHFSRAGARKLAHYVEREIRKVYRPSASDPNSMIGAIAPEGDPQPPPGAPGEMNRPRPLSSPMIVLTAPRKAEGGALAAAAMAVPARDASPDAERVLVNGETLDPEPGRLDDHRWPGATPAKAESKSETPAPPDAGPQAGLDKARAPTPAAPQPQP